MNGTMDLLGKKLYATEPGRYYQFMWDTVAAPGFKLETVAPSAYWMEIKTVVGDTLTYDSFVVRPDYIIQQLKNGRACKISLVMAEINNGHLEIK